MSIQTVLLYGGSGVILVWGVGHIMPTRNVVEGFGPISPDNRMIITMEWLIEGLTLYFLGVLVGLATAVLGPEEVGTRLVARAAGGMLFLLAGVSAFTGARTAVLPMRLCPFVKSAVGVSFIGATFV